jgi:hypothetical protein
LDLSKIISFHNYYFDPSYLFHFIQKVPKPQQNFKVQKLLCSNQSSHGQPTYKNEIAPVYGLDLFVKATHGDSLKWDRKLDDHVDL